MKFLTLIFVLALAGCATEPKWHWGKTPDGPDSQLIGKERAACPFCASTDTSLDLIEGDLGRWVVCNNCGARARISKWGERPRK